MKFTSLAIPDVIVFEPKVFGDDRGFFFESFNQRQFEEAVGKTVRFVQDNHSRSVKGVLRGLHYQIQQPQGKLVRVVQGEVFDVAVDIRKNSPTFGKWVGEVFAAALCGPDAEPRLDSLVVATDLYTWKLVRRDMARSVKTYRQIVENQISAALTFERARQV